MEIVESQALMEDNAALLPQRGGRTREHCSVHLTNFNPFPTDEFDEFHTMVEMIASLCFLRAMLLDS